MPESCTACGAEITRGQPLCGECAAGPPRNCSRCGSLIPAIYAFCGFCGLNLREASAPARPSGEKRRAAILFADLQGSTELGHRLQAEEVYAAVSQRIQVLAEVVERHRGYVVKTLGDGILATFGAPVARGDDARSAGLAALAMQEALAASRWPDGFALKLRVGLNWGSVVAAPMVGAGGKLVFDVLGDAVNVAQRIEAAATPGSVFASLSLYELARGDFQFAGRGAAALKGKPEPLPLYEILAPRERPMRTEWPLYGRQVELTRFHELLSGLAGGGEGGVGMLLLQGPSGIGKSRLLREFGAIALDHELLVLRGSGLPVDLGSPLSLWRRWMHEYLAPDSGQSRASLREQVYAAIHNPADAAWIFALLAEPERLGELAPAVRQHAIRSAVTAFLDYVTDGRPALLLVDEAEHLDELSGALLMEVSRRRESGEVRTRAGVAVAAACRARPAWAEGETIALGPLAADVCEAWVRDAHSELSLASPELSIRLVAMAEGHPLHQELLLSHLQSSQAGDGAELRLPENLYAALRAELDALPEEARELAGACAVLGRSFRASWIALSENEESLNRLLAAGVLVETAPPPRRELQFRLGSLQELLYDSLLAGARRRLHERSARAISPQAEADPGLSRLVAAHFQSAGERNEELQWLLSAAEHAAATLPAEDARQDAESALALGQELGCPVSQARAEICLAACAAHRGDAEAARAGLGSALARLDPGAGTAAAQARASALLALARLDGERGQFASALSAVEEALALLGGEEAAPVRIQSRLLCELAHLSMDTGAFEAGISAASAAREMSRSAGEQPLWAAASAALGLALAEGGRWEEAEPILREAALACEAAPDPVGAAACWINLAHGLRPRGRHIEAVAALASAQAAAASAGDRLKQALARLDLSAVEISRGGWSRAISEAARAAADFAALDHPLGEAAARLNLAEAWFRSGSAASAEVEAEAALELARMTEITNLQAAAMLLLAEIRSRAGDVARTAELLRETAELGPAEPSVRALLALQKARIQADPAVAARLLESALAELGEDGSPIERARLRAELARLLEPSGREEEAQALRDAAESELQSMGMDAWLPWLQEPS